MSKLYYTTQRSFKLQESHKEHPLGESETVPGKSRTIKELLAKMNQGQQVQFRAPVFMDEVDIDSINHLFGPAIDLTDLDALQARIESAGQSLKAAQDAKKRKMEDEAKARAKAELEAEAKGKEAKNG